LRAAIVFLLKSTFCSEPMITTRVLRTLFLGRTFVAAA
jgi:hypothetical protein